MKREKGFTLVEMVIAIAVSSLIVTFLSQIIGQSMRVYSIAVENNEAMTKIAPVLKRIESDIASANGNITAVSQIGNTSFAGITIQGDFGTHSYFWDGSGNGAMDAAEVIGVDDNSKSIYRVSGTAIDVILSSKGIVPPTLVLKYGADWNTSIVKIKNFYFSFYREEPAGSGRSTVWDITNAASTMGAIKYVAVHVDIEGVREQSVFKFDTGVKVRN